MANTYKMIPVHPTVHERVQGIATANRRTLGGQIAHWVTEDCEHPADQRQSLVVSYQFPEELNSKTAKPHAALGYICGVCKRLVITDPAKQSVN